MQKISCIALDMDGTLLDNQHRISEQNKHWIHTAEQEGITVCLATGRGVQGIEQYVDELQLTSPYVVVNGSEVWENPQKLTVRHQIDVETILNLRQVAIAADCWYWGYTVNGIYNRERWCDNPEEHIWLKFGIASEEAGTIEKLRVEVDQVGQFEVTNSHPNNLELNPRGISKATGLLEVCRILDITMANIVAVGDSLNDLAMIRGVGQGVAMGNAQEIIKQAADWVTLTNEENGVAHVIKQVLHHH